MGAPCPPNMSKCVQNHSETLTTSARAPACLLWGQTAQRPRDEAIERPSDPHGRPSPRPKQCLSLFKTIPQKANDCARPRWHLFGARRPSEEEATETKRLCDHATQLAYFGFAGRPGPLPASLAATGQSVGLPAAQAGSLAERRYMCS